METLVIMTMSEDGLSASPFIPSGGDGYPILLDDYSYASQRMGQSTLTATLKHPLCLDTRWTGREFVEWRDGTRLMLSQTPSSQKGNDDRRYVHTLVFESERERVLDNVYFVDAVLPGETPSDARLSGMAKVRFAGSLQAFVKRVNDVMRARDIDPSFTVSVEEGVETEDRFVEFDELTVFGALQKAFEEWDVPFYFVGNACVFGFGANDTLGVDLEYGHYRELLETKRNNDNAKIVTRCSGTGSSDNIPYFYPNPTAKGTIEVQDSGLGVVIDDMQRFAERFPLGRDVQYGVVRFDNTAPLVNVIRDGVATREKIPSPADFGTFHPNAITSLDGRTRNSKVIPCTLTFNVSRGSDLAGEIMYANVRLTVNGDQITPTDSVPWYQSKIARDSSQWATYHKSFRYGMVTMRNVNSWDQDYDPKQAVSDDVFEDSEGKVYKFTNEDTDSGIVEVNYGNVQHDFNGINAEVYVKEVATFDPGATYTMSQYQAEGYRIVTRRKDSNPSHGSVCSALEYDTVRNYFGQPITFVIPLRRNETKAITVTFEVTMPYVPRNPSNASIGANVKLSWKAEVDNGSGWWLDGRKRDLAWFGLSLPEDIQPNEGDWIRQTVLQKVPFSDTLMPSVFRETLGMERFYPAVNSELTLDYPLGMQHTFGPYPIPGTDPQEYYQFVNEYVPGYPREHIEKFEDIKPTIKGILNADGREMAVVEEVFYESGFDPSITAEDGTSRAYPWFFVRLRPTDGAFAFNLFDCASDKDEMKVVMTSGDCCSAEFKVVGLEMPDGRYMNPVKVVEELFSDDSLIIDGGTPSVSHRLDIAGGRVSMATSAADCDSWQQDTRNGVWLALMVDSQTFGGDEVDNGTVPMNKPGFQVKTGDSFVVTGINLPDQFVLAAEKRLEEAIIQFMSENNEEKFTYSIQFSRDWLATHPTLRDRINEHSILDIVYDGRRISKLYVESYTYKASTDALPEISVELGDVIETRSSGINARIEKAKNEVLERVSINNIRLLIDDYYLRKDRDDVAQGRMAFMKGLEVGRFVPGTLGSGGAMSVSDGGESSIEVDFLKVRRKATFSEVEIEKLRQVGGQIAVSCASGEIVRVSLADGVYRCFLDLGNNTVGHEFAEGDLVRSQSFNDGGHYWWRRCVGVGADYIDLSLDDADENSDAPAAGDTAVQFGSATDVQRQSVQMMSCYGTDAPSYVIYNGVDGYSLEGKDIGGIRFDSEKGEPVAFIYGDMHIGDRIGDGRQYLRYYRNEEGERLLEINGAALSDLLAVKDENGNVVAGMNGGGRYGDSNGRIMIFAGSDSDNADDVKASDFIVYENGKVIAKQIYAEDGGSIGGFSINKTNGLRRVDAKPAVGDYREVVLGDHSLNYAYRFVMRRAAYEGEVGSVNIIQGSFNPILDVLRDANAGSGSTVPAMLVQQPGGLAMVTSGDISSISGVFKGFRDNVRTISSGTTGTFNFDEGVIVLNVTTAFTLYLAKVVNGVVTQPEAGTHVRIIKKNASGSLTVNTRNVTINKFGFDNATTAVFGSGRKAVLDYFFDGTEWYQFIIFN